MQSFLDFLKQYFYFFFYVYFNNDNFKYKLLLILPYAPSKFIEPKWQELKFPIIKNPNF